MQINFNSAIEAKQLSFQAVNQKYLKEAQKWQERRGTITSEWYEALTDDVVLFKDISKQDAIDTMNAVRKYATRGIEVFESTLKYLRRL